MKIINDADNNPLIDRGRYDALVVGRRGMGKVGELFFGSVTAFLVGKCHEIPIWLIDGEITSNRFLLAVHSKPQSLLAADHLAFMARSNPDAEILLYHSNILFSNDKLVDPEEFQKIWGKLWKARIQRTGINQTLE